MSKESSSDLPSFKIYKLFNNHQQHLPAVRSWGLIKLWWHIWSALLQSPRPLLCLHLLKCDWCLSLFTLVQSYLVKAFSEWKDIARLCVAVQCGYHLSFSWVLQALVILMIGLWTFWWEKEARSGLYLNNKCNTFVQWHQKRFTPIYPGFITKNILCWS